MYTVRMLTHRMQVLLDEQTLSHLRLVAKRENLSVGEVIRQAVIKTYIGPSSTESSLHKRVLAFRKRIKGRGIKKKDILTYAHYDHRI